MQAVTSMDEELNQTMDVTQVSDQMVDVFVDRLKYTHVEEVTETNIRSSLL